MAPISLSVRIQTTVTWPLPNSDISCSLTRVPSRHSDSGLSALSFLMTTLNHYDNNSVSLVIFYLGRRYAAQQVLMSVCLSEFQSLNPRNAHRQNQYKTVKDSKKQYKRVQNSTRQNKTVQERKYNLIQFRLSAFLVVTKSKPIL